LVEVVGPLVSMVGAARGRAERVVRAADFQALGGVEGGMKRHVEPMLNRLFPAFVSRRGLRLPSRDARGFMRLLGENPRLYLQQPDGRLTTALGPEAVAEEGGERFSWDGRVWRGEGV